MTAKGINEAQRTAAKVAGVVYPISFLIVVAVNFGIFARLLVGNPAENARQILAHEILFRIGIAGDMVYCVGVVVVLTALYIILKPVSQGLALFMALGRLIHGLTWLLATLSLFTALRLLSDADYRELGADHLPILAQLYLSGVDAYYVGLLFWALGATVGGYLWFKSNYIPRALAVFGVASSAWCAACTLFFYVFPNFPKVVNLWWFDTPMVIFETVLSFWLLFRGLRAGGEGPATPP
jgi:hypothetical protein